MRAHALVLLHVRACVRACVRGCVRVRVRAWVRANVCVRANVRACVRANVRVFACAYVCFVRAHACVPLPCMRAPVMHMLCSRMPNGWEIIKAVVPGTIPGGKLKMCNDSKGDIYINADEFGNSWYRCCCVALHTHLGLCQRARRHGSHR